MQETVQSSQNDIGCLDTIEGQLFADIAFVKKKGVAWGGIVTVWLTAILSYVLACKLSFLSTNVKFFLLFICLCDLPMKVMDQFSYKS